MLNYQRITITYILPCNKPTMMQDVQIFIIDPTSFITQITTSCRKFCTNHGHWPGCTRIAGWVCWWTLQHGGTQEVAPYPVSMDWFSEVWETKNCKPWVCSHQKKGRFLADFPRKTVSGMVNDTGGQRVKIHLPWKTHAMSNGEKCRSAKATSFTLWPKCHQFGLMGYWIHFN